MKSKKSIYFKNFPIGKTFVLDCVIYKVKIAKNMCEGCHFWYPEEQLCLDTSHRLPHCSYVCRNDHCDVIFVKVGEI